MRRPPAEGQLPVIGRPPGPDGPAGLEPLPPPRSLPPLSGRGDAEPSPPATPDWTAPARDIGEAASDPAGSGWPEPGSDEGGAEGDDTPRRYQAPIPEPPRPVRHGRYEPLETVPVRRPLPSIYRRHRILGFWYVPAALLLGAAVAVGVVLGVDYFAGGGGNSPAGRSSPTAQATAPLPTSTSPPSATPRPSDTAAATAANATPSITPLPGQFLFGPGDQVVVVGTGDCLNVRDAPTTRGRQISCLGDGVEATIISGPAEADGYRWWHVRAGGYAEGWVAEDYLGRLQ